MAKNITAQKFAAGEQVACYSSEVLQFGQVIAVDGDKVTVAIEYNVYSKHGERTTETALFEYVRRESDGLFVAAECIGQRVPSRMIARTGDIGTMNRWRYWPTPLEKLVRKFSK
jgi:hypothetical protein